MSSSLPFESLPDFAAAVVRIIVQDSFDDGEGEEEHIVAVFFNDLEGHNMFGKGGQPPASMAAIESLPMVTVTEEEECAICLTDYGGGVAAKQMPCKHNYHLECLSKWLEIHGSCPVCRFKMPVDEEEEKMRRESGDSMVVNVMIMSRRRGSGDSDGAPTNGSDQNPSDLRNGNGSSASSTDMDTDNDGNSNQDMELDNNLQRFF